MGTRNLTIVRFEGETRVAQYGQWDGYPSGQGQTIADFLTVVDLAKFKKQVKALKKYSRKAISKAYEDAGADPKSLFMSCDVAYKAHVKHPALNRDHGAGILKLIHDGDVKKVVISEDFKEDKLFCEYYYEINLDDETVQMNGRKKYSFDEWKKPGLMKRLK